MSGPSSPAPAATDEYDLSHLPPALEALHAERQKQGWSAIDLELHSGVTTSAIYDYRSGRIPNPGIANIVALAEALGFVVIMRRKDAGQSDVTVGSY